MTPLQAIAFVRNHGIALEAATGPVPSLAAAIAGEPIRGSWWGHPRSREIFALTRAVRDAPDVLVCRLVEGRITFVHRRLWPSLVRVANCFSAQRLARIHEVHTDSGRHVTNEIAFPGWVPDDVAQKVARLSEAAAMLDLRDCFSAPPLSKPGDDRR